MPEDPKYILGENDEIDPSFWTEKNVKAIIDGLNSTESSATIIKKERLELDHIPVPSLDGGDLDHP